MSMPDRDSRSLLGTTANEEILVLHYQSQAFIRKISEVYKHLIQSTESPQA